GWVARLSLCLRFASRLSCAVLAACAFGSAAAQDVAPAEKTTPPPAAAAAVEEQIPTFAELAGAGASIGEIRVVTRNIFDMQNERENGVLYRAANAIHVQTWP